MRVVASLFVSALLLCAGNAPAQTPQLQLQVARAVTHDLGIDTQPFNSQFGMQILGSQMQVPEQARLHVVAVQAALEGGTRWLRLECSSRLECLPFEVVLRARGRHATDSLDSGARSSSLTSSDRLAAPLVRAGQRVRLAEEISGMHLSARAVCLEAGSMGQRIRVRNMSSGRVVSARVRAAGQVTVAD